MSSMLRRTRIWWLTLISGGLFVMSGCDPTVRDSVLNGVGSAATGLATTFIQAFFQALINSGQDQTGGTGTAQVFIEEAAKLFA